MNNDGFSMVGAALMVALMGFFLFIPLVPILAFFFKLIWNDVMSYLQLHYMITYWQSLKLCFYLYIFRGLLSINVKVSQHG